jgi:capsular polysaccharide biosynthesis protein
VKSTAEGGAKELLLMLLKKTHWIVFSAGIGLAVAFYVTRFIIPPLYTSSVLLYVNNVNESLPEPPTMDLNSIYASQQLVNTYMVILQDDEVLDTVAATLTREFPGERLQAILPFTNTSYGYMLSANTLRGVVAMSAVNNTEVMRIESRTKDPEISARICSLITELAPGVLGRVVKAGSVEVIGEAKIPHEPSSPSLTVNCAIGALAGGAFSALCIILRNFLNQTVKSVEELQKRFTLPVLGEIPRYKNLYY